MQHIASILCGEQLVLVGKREIVEGVMRMIAGEEQNSAIVTCDVAKIDAETLGSKKNVEKCELGSQAMFSGRLNGVAPAAFAAALASKLVVSPACAV